ncbi:DUF5805 domain-containing protein [Halalkalicoccus subterraneus]|uniref:DUF5805 domain-containing protein n=1 Tax=Halalkalicoccus subterraneus TaxID=2675002 RepID=UPI000EFC79E9|nr:DUF5805 domain-containing protein [Halalkalicoccus subterraneus]
MAAERDTERTVVKTHVPAYQKRIWVDHAEDLNMSQSEFLRTMVQAGRKGFEPTEGPANERNVADDGTDLESRVKSVLAGSGPLSWDELVAVLTDDFEDRLDEALQSLQEENRLRYSGRDGGYTLNDRS